MTSLKFAPARLLVDELPAQLKKNPARHCALHEL